MGMTHIEELQLIKEFSQNVKGDETMKLEKEIIAMEMSLGIIKRSQKEELEQHERKKSVKGYIWKSGRGIDSKKNYAEKVLTSHQQKKTKKKMKKAKIQKKQSSVLSTSIAIQSDIPNESKSEEIQNDNICDSVPVQIKKCCYHCFTFFTLNKQSQQRDDKHFCDNECLSKYIKSTMITCSANQCQTEFTRSDGSRFHGQWFCKLHFKEHCINEMESTTTYIA